MSRHMSKADEAPSWRRTTALPSHSSSGGGGGSYSGGGHQRPASAGPATHGRASQQQQHQQLLQHQAAALMQALERPQPPPPCDFSADEARLLLDKRWQDVCEQGLQPTCQCGPQEGQQQPQLQQQDAGAADAADAAGEVAGSSPFLEALSKAVKCSSADAAWEDD